MHLNVFQFSHLFLVPSLSAPCVCVCARVCVCLQNEVSTTSVEVPDDDAHRAPKRVGLEINVKTKTQKCTSWYIQVLTDIQSCHFRINSQMRTSVLCKLQSSGFL